MAAPAPTGPASPIDAHMAHTGAGVAGSLPTGPVKDLQVAPITEVLGIWGLWRPYSLAHTLLSLRATGTGACPGRRRKQLRYGAAVREGDSYLSSLGSRFFPTQLSGAAITGMRLLCVPAGLPLFTASSLTVCRISAHCLVTCQGLCVN
ncbi:hypothetical protein NDU88_004075 [Pleurodeles waltl]|uniref:Uncharacterized protein n=1 Tax=Pleurodeles waltl TaxID=8319 RepID=A0AAV7SHS4_PLEWA|nr:hypothetical protein NDU88_004075 [Pleurodeles waltl]